MMNIETKNSRLAVNLQTRALSVAIVVDLYWLLAVATAAMKIYLHWRAVAH